MTDNKDYETHARSNESIRDNMDGVLKEKTQSTESNKDNNGSTPKDDPNAFSRG